MGVMLLGGWGAHGQRLTGGVCRRVTATRGDRRWCSCSGGSGSGWVLVHKLHCGTGFDGIAPIPDEQLWRAVVRVEVATAGVPLLGKT